MNPADPAPEPTAPPAARRRWRSAAVAALLAVLLPGAALGWLAATESGLQLLLRLIAGGSGGAVQVEGAGGRLLGPLRIERLRYASADLRIEALGVALDWTPTALLQGRLALDRVSLAGLDIATRPDDAPPQRPADMQLPLDLAVGDVQVGRLRVLGWSAAAAAEPLPLLVLERVGGELASDGQRHQARRLTAVTPLGTVRGELALDATAPFALAGSARLEGRRDEHDYAVEARIGGKLEALSIDASGSGWDLAGSARLALTPFAAVPLASAQVDLGEFDPAAFVAGAPRAALRLRADLAPRLPAGTPAPKSLADWEVGGPVSIDNRLPGLLDRQGLPLLRASAEASWKAGELALDRLELLTGGRSPGRASGKLTLRGQALHARLALAQLDPAALVGTLQPARLDGDLDLNASVDRQSFTARLRDRRWQGEIVAVHHDGRLDVSRLQLAAGAARLEASGSAVVTGQRAFTVSGRLESFDPSLYARVPAASLNARFDARGTASPLHVDGAFTLADSVLATPAGKQALAGRGKLTLTGERLTQVDVQLDLAGNRLDARGAWGQPGDVLQLAADAPRLDALGFGLGGALRLQGELSGSPARPLGRIDATATALRLPGGIRAASLALRGQLDASEDGAFTAKLDASDIAAAGQVVERASVKLDGTRGAHVLNADLALPQAQTITLAARGALADGPSWQGAIERLDLRLTRGRLALAAPARLSASAAEVSLGEAELRGEQTRLRLLESNWTPAGWLTRGDLSGLRVSRSAPAASAAAATAGLLTLAGEWQLRAGTQLDGSLRLFRQAGDLSLPGDRPITLGLSQLELAATVDHNRIEATLSAAGERLGQASGRATLAAESRDGSWRLAEQAPLAGELTVELPALDWLAPLLDPNLKLGGRARGEVRLGGTPARPDARGSLRADAVSVALVEQGLRLDDGSVRIDIDQDRARLSEFAFRADPRLRPHEARLDAATQGGAPSRLSGSGELALGDGKGEFRLVAERLAVLQRPDRWLMLSGNLTLQTAWDALAIAGTLKADAGYFELSRQVAPSLSADVVVRGREARAGKPLRVSVDLAVELGRHLYFTGRGIDTRLAGEVRLRADSASALHASGSIRTRDGTFDAYGRSLSIERGVLNFQGPIDQPTLNVRAIRKGLAVEAGVEISGSVAAPSVRLVSEPNVPDAEKLSWIVLGRGQEQGGADSGLLLAAAGTILGGPAGGVSTQLAQGLGLDQIGLAQGDGGRSGSSLLPASTVAGASSASRHDDPALSSQVVSLGKRFGNDAYLSYEHSLAGASSVAKLTYNLSRRLSLIGRAGTDNAIDLLYTISFD